MKERVRFIDEWERGDLTMVALCRKCGVSRQTGYKWVRRYQEFGSCAHALTDLSTAPHHHPWTPEPALVDLVIRARKRWPDWGPVDFKGHFRVGDGTVCYPLTIMDAHSRLLMRCEALTSTAVDHARPVFVSAFCEYGLPAALRTDNGPPFASKGAGAPTELSVWWHKLGIAHERIEPGKPQQNGRHERMHRTLKQATASPPRASCPSKPVLFERSAPKAWEVYFGSVLLGIADYTKPQTQLIPPRRTWRKCQP